MRSSARGKPFSKGHPKFGGRKKGTENKFSLRKLKDVLEEAGIDPAVEYVAMIPQMPQRDQKAAMEFLITQLSKDEEGAAPLTQLSGKVPTLQEIIRALPTTNEPKHERGG